MQTRSSRKRKLEEEKGEPNKQRKMAEDDPMLEEKFEYFLELPIELQTEIYQRCTFPVKIHFNEDAFTEELPAYAKYLTALEELRLAVYTPEQILYPTRFLTNLRKLAIPDCFWPDHDLFGRLTRLTGLHSLNLSCRAFLIEHMTVFKQLTELKCNIRFEDGIPSQQPSFDPLTNLKSLQITGDFNPIVIKISELTQLEVLKLWNVELEENNAPLQNFNKLTQLEFGTNEQSKSINITFQMPQVYYLSLRYYSASETFFNNFPNVTTFKSRGFFALPSNADQLKRLSLSSIYDYTKDNIDALSKLTKLQSLSLHGSFLAELIDTNCNLPISLKELSLEEYSTTSLNILPYLTRLSNLERVTLIEVTPFFSSGFEEEFKSFLKSMQRQLKMVFFKGTSSRLIPPPQNERSWNCYLRKNNIYIDVIFE